MSSLTVEERRRNLERLKTLTPDERRIVDFVAHVSGKRPEDFDVMIDLILDQARSIGEL